MCEMALNGPSLSTGSAAVLHACVASADVLSEGESPCFCTSSQAVKRPTAAAHACVRMNRPFYEGNTACTLFCCQTKKGGHFQTCCTGRVSEDLFKDVDGTFICRADSLYNDVPFNSCLRRFLALHRKLRLTYFMKLSPQL